MASALRIWARLVACPALFDIKYRIHRQDQYYECFNGIQTKHIGSSSHKSCIIYGPVTIVFCHLIEQTLYCARYGGASFTIADSSLEARQEAIS